MFEEFLKDAPNDASYDAVRQSVVVLMGSLAKHLDKSDPKVKPIVAKLIAALSTPSQQVCPPTTRSLFGWAVQTKFGSCKQSRVSNPDGHVLCPSLRGLPSLFIVRNALVESQFVTMF